MYNVQHQTCSNMVLVNRTDLTINVRWDSQYADKCGWPSYVVRSYHRVVSSQGLSLSLSKLFQHLFILHFIIKTTTDERTTEVPRVTPSSNCSPGLTRSKVLRLEHRRCEKVRGQTCTSRALSLMATSRWAVLAAVYSFLAEPILSLISKYLAV